jgi:hypothetical protein
MVLPCSHNYQEEARLKASQVNRRGQKGIYAVDHPSTPPDGPQENQTCSIRVGLATEFRIDSIEHCLKTGIYIVGIGTLAGS